MIFQSLETKVLNAQSDSELLEKLIGAHLGFIKKCMTDQQKASGAHLEEETTVAMLAFSEAVAQYDIGKGKFLSFARLVITRRMVDEYRKQLKQSPWGSRSLDEPLSEEEESQHPYEAEASLVAYEQEVKRSNLQMEIALYEEQLHRFGLTFSELAEVSPKQDAVKAAYKAIARWLVKEPDLLKRLYADQKMPMNEIMAQFEIDRKKLERGRKYIIALVVLLNSDLELIQNYLERR